MGSSELLPYNTDCPTLGSSTACTTTHDRPYLGGLPGYPEAPAAAFTVDKGYTEARAEPFEGGGEHPAQVETSATTADHAGPLAMSKDCPFPSDRRETANTSPKPEGDVPINWKASDAGGVGPPKPPDDKGAPASGSEWDDAFSPEERAYLTQIEQEVLDEFTLPAISPPEAQSAEEPRADILRPGDRVLISYAEIPVAPEDIDAEKAIEEASAALDDFADQYDRAVVQAQVPGLLPPGLNDPTAFTYVLPGCAMIVRDGQFGSQALVASDHKGPVLTLCEGLTQQVAMVHIDPSVPLETTIERIQQVFDEVPSLRLPSTVARVFGASTPEQVGESSTLALGQGVAGYLYKEAGVYNVAVIPRIGEPDEQTNIFVRVSSGLTLAFQGETRTYGVVDTPPEPAHPWTATDLALLGHDPEPHRDPSVPDLSVDYVETLPLSPRDFNWAEGQARYEYRLSDLARPINDSLRHLPRLRHTVEQTASVIASAFERIASRRVSDDPEDLARLLDGLLIARRQPLEVQTAVLARIIRHHSSILQDVGPNHTRDLLTSRLTEIISRLDQILSRIIPRYVPREAVQPEALERAKEQPGPLSSVSLLAKRNGYQLLLAMARAPRNRDDTLWS